MRYFLGATLIFIGGGLFAFYSNNQVVINADSDIPVYKITRTIEDKPEYIKAVYMTSWVASTPSLRERLIELVLNKEFNAIVIDVKDEYGDVTYYFNNKEIIDFVTPTNRIKDLPVLLKQLNDLGIYTIARIVVFQDPKTAKLYPDLAIKNKNGNLWQDKKKLAWIDPSAQDYWHYIKLLSIESHKLGFDEVNFDYIRFPSDGNMKDIVFPVSNLEQNTRREILVKFFKYLDKELRGVGITTSADVFGMTTTSFDDLGIGQVLEDFLPYFDFIAPMIYPSHYPPNFYGFTNPNDYPYEIIKLVSDQAVKRAASSTPKLRPWLQDFHYPRFYTVEDIKKQKQAVYDSGLSSWMVWDPKNLYTKEAYDDNLVED